MIGLVIKKKERRKGFREDLSLERFKGGWKKTKGEITRMERGGVQGGGIAQLCGNDG